MRAYHSYYEMVLFAGYFRRPITAESNVCSQEHKRTSYATEYIGKITYPAGWAWSAAQVLLEGIEIELPGFMRDAIEFGVPSEAAAALVRIGHLTHSAALSVASMAGFQWEAARDWLTDEDHVSNAAHGLTGLDADRLRRLHEQLSLEMS
jgi:hypothetical protein